MESSKQPLNSLVPSARHAVEHMSSYKAPLEGRRKYLRLDFNENTIGPSKRVLEAIQQISPQEISIYPEYSGLKEEFATSISNNRKIIDINSTNIGIFNGVDAAIHAIFHSYGDRGDYLLTTSPTFGYYSPCALMQGMSIISIAYQGEKFSFPLKEMQHALASKQPRLMLICNPNNPTGTRLRPEEIINMAMSNPQTLIVVDELYEAFTGDSILSIVDFNKTPNLLALRSLSKTAGLAGLRIGFAIGNDYVISRVNRVTGPYDVNSFAVKAAFAALQDQEYTNDYVKEVLIAKDWIKGCVESTKLRNHFDGGNYFLVWPQNADKAEELLKRSGVLVRNMKGKELIDGSLRVSVGTITQMKEFWNKFSEII